MAHGSRRSPTVKPLEITLFELREVAGLAELRAQMSTIHLQRNGRGSRQDRRRIRALEELARDTRALARRIEPLTADTDLRALGS